MTPDTVLVVSRNILHPGSFVAGAAMALLCVFIGIFIGIAICDEIRK